MHTEPAARPLAWFRLEDLLPAGVEAESLLALAAALEGRLRRWPEPILSGPARWRPNLPAGDYLTIPVDRLP